MAKVEKMTEDLKKMLDEPYRECALKYYKLEYGYGTKGVSKRPIVRFHFLLTEKLLNPFVITPSKIRKKILTEIAQQINKKLRLVTTDFFRLDFLSKNDPCEAALKGYFTGKFTDIKSFFEMVEKEQSKRNCYRPRGLMDEQFFNLLEAKQPICALACILKKNLSCLFVGLAQDSTCDEKTLAKTVWFNSFEGQGDEDQQYRDAYVTMTGEWPKALEGFRAYVTWIYKGYSEDRRDRHFKLPYVCEKACSNASLLPLLVDGKFEELDKIVSEGFDSYMWRLMR